MGDYDDNFFRCMWRMLNKVITNCGLKHEVEKKKGTTVIFLGKSEVC